MLQAQNTNLIKVAREIVKRRNKQVGNLSRGQVIGGKKKGLEALE